MKVHHDNKLLLSPRHLEDQTTEEPKAHPFAFDVHGCILLPLHVNLNFRRLLQYQPINPQIHTEVQHTTWLELKDLLNFVPNLEWGVCML